LVLIIRRATYWPLCSEVRAAFAAALSRELTILPRDILESPFMLQALVGLIRLDCGEVSLRQCSVPPNCYHRVSTRFRRDSGCLVNTFIKSFENVSGYQSCCADKFAWNTHSCCCYGQSDRPRDGQVPPRHSFIRSPLVSDLAHIQQDRPLCTGRRCAAPAVQGWSTSRFACNAGPGKPAYAARNQDYACCHIGLQNQVFHCCCQSYVHNTVHVLLWR
jgi:hypothetical protein